MFLLRDSSAFQDSGTRKLQAYPPLAVRRLSIGKYTLMAVTTMESNDLAAEEEKMNGSNCLRCNRQTGRCGSIAFGSSTRRGKTLTSNPAVLRKYPIVKKTSGDNLD